MFIVHVHVHVRPEFVAAFKKATIENAHNSVQEPGIARFDVIQQKDDPTRLSWSRFTAPLTTRRSTRRRATTRPGVTRWRR